MNETSFKILHKNPIKKISIELRVILVLGFFTFLSIIFYKFIYSCKIIEQAGTFFALSILFIAMLLLITSPFRYERLNGFINGDLIFSKDYILVEKTKYNIIDVSKIEINNLDIRGKWTNMLLDFEPKKSNGVKNFIRLYLKNGKIIEVYFLQTKTQNVKTCKEEFISYYDQNKISWNNLSWVIDLKKENILKK